MEELLGRQAPHDAAAEQAIIGSMLIDPACVPDVINKVRAEEFYIQTNREIFETIFSMFSFGKEIDPVTVMDQMKVRGVFREGTTQQYLMEVMNLTPTAANVLKYAAIVRDQALLRNLQKAADEIHELVAEGTGEADTVLEAAERKIYQLRQGRNVGGLQPVSMVIQRVYTALSDAAVNGGGIPGLSTGMPDLDQVTMGLKKGELILIAARPGQGKTSMALNLARYIGEHSGQTVAVFSLEMSREELVQRLLSSAAMVDGKKLAMGRLSPAEWDRVVAAASQLSKTDIRVDDNSTLSVADMNAQCRRLGNLGLVVIDYLQLMQGDDRRRSDNRVQEVGDISRGLKLLAKKLNVPVIACAQLSRGPEGRVDKRPMLSDLRDSGAIEQDADIVLFLYRDEYYKDKENTKSLAEVIVAKNRHGSLEKVKLGFIGQYTKFTNLSPEQSSAVD